MADTKYSVTWDAYQKSICNGLSSLQQKGEFVDMTLAAEGHHVKVHQMVMSLVSPYIKDLISSAACPHPVIFLNKLSYETLQSILQYAYTGEVVVSNEKLQEFLTACKDLHIRGLESLKSMETATCKSKKPTNKKSEMPPTIITNKQGSKSMFESPLDEDDDVNQTEESHIDYSMGSGLDDDITQNPFDDNEEIKTTSTMANKKETEVVFQYSVSNRGTKHSKLQVVMNQYIYYLRHTRKTGDTMWRCADYQRRSCPAYLVTYEDRIQKRACAHNHPYHDKQILKRLRNRNIFSSINEAQLAIDKKKDELDKTKPPSAATQAAASADTDDE